MMKFKYFLILFLYIYLLYNMSNSEELYNSENANVLDRLSQEQTAKQRLNEGLLDVDNRVRDSKAGVIEAQAGQGEAGLGTGSTTAILGGAVRSIYKSRIGKSLRKKAIEKFKQKLQERKNKQNQNGEDDNGNDLGDTSNVDPVQSQEIATQTRTDINTKDFPDQETTPEDLIDPNEPVEDPTESGVSDSFNDTLNATDAESKVGIDAPEPSTETLPDIPDEPTGLQDYGDIFGDPESLQNIQNIYGGQDAPTPADDVDTSDISPATAEDDLASRTPPTRDPEPEPEDDTPAPADDDLPVDEPSSTNPTIKLTDDDDPNTSFTYDPDKASELEQETEPIDPAVDEPPVSSLTEPTDTTLATQTEDPAGASASELANQTTMDGKSALQAMLKNSGMDDDTITNLMSGFSKGDDVADLLDAGTSIFGEGASTLLGTVGSGILDALGPLGAIGGLVGGIYSLVEEDDAQETAQKNAKAYQTDLTSLSATPSLSTGSIAMPTMDTTQFRTGGMMNF